MVRFFGKPKQADGEAPEPPKAAPESAPAAAPSSAFPMPRRYGAGGDHEMEGSFELRAPTPEEIAAPILFERDLAGLDDLLSSHPAAVVIDEPAPAPGPAAELIGFFEHFEPGLYLAGWVGDPDQPDCRTLRVTAIVDGQDVGSAVADRAREDTVYGGFEIAFRDPDVARLIVEDRLILQVTRDGKRAAVLPSLASVIELAQALATPSIEPEPVPPELATPAAAPAPAVLAPEAPVPIAPVPAAHADLSEVSVPVGLMSRDGAAIVGRQGFLFAYREHDMIGQYRADSGPSGAVQRDAAKWFALFRARKAALAERQIAYVQTIMPDKATALAKLAPAGLGPITPRLGVLEAMIDAIREREGDAALSWYRSLVAPLRSGHAAGLAPYLRFDTHLSAAGTQLVFHQLIQKMSALMPAHASAFTVISGHCAQINPGRDGEPFAGNLGAQFDFPLYECDSVQNLGGLKDLLVGKPAFARFPKQGAIGTRLMWSNPKAPSALRVMVFGSSFFGTGSNLRSLSWWFKTMFAEFHFIWDDAVDLAYVDQHRPDVVICQGVESRLPAVSAR